MKYVLDLQGFDLTVNSCYYRRGWVVVTGIGWQYFNVPAEENVAGFYKTERGYQN